MELREIDVKRFNNLASAEPDSSIYQTSWWSDYLVDKGAQAMFIEADDNAGSCVALTMLILKKESFISGKYTAYAPFGYLINYFDEPLLSEFHELLIKYLKDHKISKIEIEPQVNENNSLVLKALSRNGYVKSDDLCRYELDIDKYVITSNDLNIIIKMRSCDDTDIINILSSGKEAKEYLDVFAHIKDHATIYAARIDSEKTKRTIKESVREIRESIDEHADDYKFAEKNAEKELEIRQLRKKYTALEKFEKSQGENPYVAAICISDFSDKCTIMFKLNIDDDEMFNVEKIIIDQLCQDYKVRGVKRIDSRSSFYGSKVNPLIGRFTCKI